MSPTENVHPAPPASSLRDHIKRTLTLAWPVVLARSGIIVLFTVDTVMVGQAASDELAFLSLGMAIQGTLLLVCIGLLQGTMIVSSQAYGADDLTTCGRAWRGGIYHALFFGSILGLVCLAGEWMLLNLGQSPELAEGGGRVSVHFGWGMPAMLLYVASSYFLESVQRPRIGMAVMAIINLVNFVLNGILIFDWGGFGFSMGAEGAVIATSVARWVAATLMVTYILTMPWRMGEDPFGLRVPLATLIHDAVRLSGPLGRKLRGLGAAMGMAYGLEMAAFSAIVFMAGLIGPTALAAHQITGNAVGLVVMGAIGMAAATGVRTGNSVGRHDAHGVQMAGWVGMGLAGLFLVIPMIFMVAIPAGLAELYVSDPDVIEIARWTFLIAGLFLMADGVMNVAMGACRGAGDVWTPMFLHILSFWVMGVPLAWALAFPLEMGAVGLQIGIAVAVYLSALGQMTRFYIVSRRPIRRV